MSTFVGANPKDISKIVKDDREKKERFSHRSGGMNDGFVEVVVHQTSNRVTKSVTVIERG